VVINLLDRKGLAANVTSDFVSGVNLHNEFRRFLHQSIFTTRTLVIVSIATGQAEKLGALIILALLRIIHNFLADSTYLILIQAVNRGRTQP
jgi:hypothetical protein